jgi:ammonium transporter, Amt family
VAAHGVGGLTGALLTGVFASKAWGAPVDGAIFGNIAQLGVQAVGLLATIVFSGGLTFGLLKLVALVLPLKAAPMEEGQGLDVSQHGEEAYTSGEGALLLLPETPAAGGAR